MGTFQFITEDVVHWAQKYTGPLFHAMVSDFPYDLGFMNKDWDKDAQFKTWGAAVLPVLYPGALAMVFGGTRTWHRMAIGMETSGFEIWDTLMWLYGNGFPKGQDISKLIDRNNGDEREITRAGIEKKDSKYSGKFDLASSSRRCRRDNPASDSSAPWIHRRTSSLKPAWEPILAFKKPLDKTYAETALSYGSGAINIQGERYPANLIRHGDKKRVLVSLLEL